jgi:CubicO group peptidase (beta-lactamase class C family)
MTHPIDPPRAQAAGFSSSRLERLSDMFRADCAAGTIPGAVILILRRDELAYHEAFGYSNRRTMLPMQRDCIFRIASMTKPVTVVAALLLLEQGKLLLADPVSKYIPQFGALEVGVESTDPASGERRLGLEGLVRPVTVHDLMRHTAGLTYGQFGDSLVQRAYRRAQVMDDQQTNAEMVDKLAQLPLAYQPGGTFEYGMSTDVLGRIVEIVSGSTLERFFAEHITGPLGMHDTGFGIDARAADRLAEPLREAPAATPPALAPYHPAKPAKWFSGGGGLLSTAADYGRFAQMLMNGGQHAGTALLARKTVQLMLSDHLPPNLAYGPLTAELGLAAPLPRLGQGYGLGLGVRLEPGLAPVPGSVGDFYWGGALGTYFWVDPAEGLVVVLMLQELNVQRRTRYRALLRGLVYQALQ